MVVPVDDPGKRRSLRGARASTRRQVATRSPGRSGCGPSSSTPTRTSHPDAAERFNDLVAAYDVLSNHRTRREYDQHAEPADHIGGGGRRLGRGPPRERRPGAEPPDRARWSRRRALTALIAGALVTVLGHRRRVLTWTCTRATPGATPSTGRSPRSGSATATSRSPRPTAGRCAPVSPSSTARAATSARRLWCVTTPRTRRHVIVDAQHPRPRHHTRDRGLEVPGRRARVRLLGQPPPPQPAPGGPTAVR